MADPNRDALIQRLQEINAELARRGEPVRPIPGVQAPAPAAAPVTPASTEIPSVDAMGSVTGGTEQVTPPGADPLGKVLPDVAGGVWESPGAVVRGVTGAVQETGNLIKDTFAGVREQGNKLMPGLGDFTTAGMNAASGGLEAAAHLGSWIAGAVRDNFPERETVTGGFIESAAQFVTGMIGAGKFVALPKAAGGKIAKVVGEKAAPYVVHSIEGMGKGAVADFAVFNGTDERLANLVNDHTSFGFFVTEYLAAKPGDSQAEGRFKNMLEGLALGPVVDAVFFAVKARKLYAEGKPKEAAEAVAEAEKAFDAYHGSRHDLTEFDSNKIGTGEGTQLEGHGHYVTETKGVAEFYKTAGVDIGVDSKESAMRYAAEVSGETDPGKIAEWLRRNLNDKEAGLLWDHTSDEHKYLTEAAKAFEAGEPVPPKVEGNLYDLKIKADKDAFLLWDEPMTAQNPATLAKMTELMQKHGGIQMPPEATGRQYYQQLSALLGGDKEASRALAEAGVPGNKYLDGNSRDGRRLRDERAEATPKEVAYYEGRAAEAEAKAAAATDPKERAHHEMIAQNARDSIERIKAHHEEVRNKPETFNYVLFSDDALEVTGKNGVPMKPSDGRVNVSNEAIDRTQKALAAKWAVAGEEMARTGHMINLRTITSDDDLKAALNATTAANVDLIDKYRGGAERDWTEVRRDAEEFADIAGANVDKMMMVMQHDAASVKHLDSRLHVYKQFMLGAIEDAGRLADAALAAKGTAEGAKAASEAAHSASIAIKMVAMVKGIETNVARTMAAQRISKEARRGLQDYTEIAGKLAAGNLHIDDEALLRQLASLRNNPKGFAKMVDKTFGQKLSGVFNSWLMNALLSSPKTHVANFLSNTAMTMYAPLERVVAGMMPGSGTTATAAMRRGLDEYVGLFSGLMDSWRAADQAFRVNQSIIDPGNGKHLDPAGHNVDAMSARGLGLTNDFYDATGNLVRTEATPVLSNLADGISTAVGMPSRLLTASDELFKQINYRAYLYGEGAQRARELGLDPSSKQFSTFVAQHINDSFDAQGGALNKGARQVAREATFTQDLEHGFGRWLQGATNEVTPLKLVVPFVRTPTNIFRFTWQHTPVIGAFQKGMWDDRRAGGSRRAQMMAKQATGLAMAMTAYGLAATGSVTGSLSPNPEIRKAQEAAGMKEFSITVPGQAPIQYNRLDPFGTTLGLMADLYSLGGHISDGEHEKLIAGATMALAANLSSKTYLQGMTNVFNAIGDFTSGRSSTGIDSWIARTAGSVIVPSIVNSLKNDESLREIRSVVDSVRSRVGSPGTPPVRNFLGEVVDAPNALGSRVWSPLGMGIGRDDPIYTELARLMTTVDHSLARVLPTLEGTKVDLRDLKLKNGQNGYDRLQQLLWESGVKDSLTKLFTSDAYKAAPDGAIDNPSAEGSKLSFVNRIVQTHKDIARAKLYSENPDLVKLVFAEKARMQTLGVRPDQPRLYEPSTFLDRVFGDPRNRPVEGFPVNK